MNEKDLKNIVYAFYPKNISYNAENDRYIVTEEFQRLNQVINDFDCKYKKSISEKILKEFENDYTLKNFQDFTLFHWGDRCMTFNLSIIENRELYTVSLLISVLAPYYTIKCQKNMIELLFSESRIAELEEKNLEKRNLKDIILKIESIVEEKLLYNKFPNEILNLIVEDISFQEAEIGYFKMFNAFFNNLMMTENEE
ncbi:hypothetical protein [Flavobacterium sp. MDT1-60]|uniref:hypothetical protein n=1 Tax=Flavobacterium sp. MDT1-60 TaxID=1979344 RepID=UPI00177F2910|nr:hypothetical protein [Flavobacterium sp. MDT1-60]QOG04818.1 hypothetical protein IHE43_11760 [Flavobacterium sp. MDT1-60]